MSAARSRACLLALALLGAPAAAQVETVRFDITSANLAIFGVQFSADYLAPPNGQQLEARAHLEYTTGSLDASQIQVTLQAPSAGVPLWQLTGADLGWSGFGSFTADVSTQSLAGPIELGDPPPDFSLYLVDLRTTTGAPMSGSFSGSYFEVDIDPWADLGDALPPLAGSAPTFDPEGFLDSGSLVGFGLDGAPASAVSFLVASTQRLAANFKGGVLVPAPDVLLTRVADAGGSVQVGFLWPAGVPAGVPIYVQWWVQDAAGPVGFTASDAFKGVTR